jgi:hypothetical protein
MSNETKHGKSTGHGDYERRDIGITGVLYFLLGLAVAGLLVHFLVTGLYSYLQKRSETDQPPLNPLVTNAPKDTRHIPPEYKGSYEDYLNRNFPAPQLEIDERTELNKDRLREEQTLNTYGWVDQKAGTVRIPIERAMELIAQRGLPTRAVDCNDPNVRCVAGAASERVQRENKKGTTQ